MAGNNLFLAPPWGDGYTKYRLGLNPIHEENWFNQPISKEVFEHKFNLLNNRYREVVAATEDSLQAQIKGVRTEMQKNIDSIQSQIQQLQTDTDAKLAEINKSIASS